MGLLVLSFVANQLNSRQNASIRDILLNIYINNIYLQCMNSRQKKEKYDILSIKNLPDIFSRAELEDLIGINSRAAQRIISVAIAENNLLLSEKKGRVQFYRKNVKNFSAYQKNFIDKYIPNKTLFFSMKELAELKKIAVFNSLIDQETFSIKVYERLMIDLSWGSSRLEGNTYSLLDTEKLILNNQISEGKNLLETQMILNHKEAIKFIIMNRDKIEYKETVLKSIHALLSENLLSNPASIGAFRKIPVAISGTIYTPLNVPQLLIEEIEVFIKKIFQIKNPFEQSLFCLIFIPYIQPFEDINKRTSRVCCNIPLIKNGLIPISFKNIEREEYFTAIKEIYERNKIEKIKEIYFKALKYSAQDYSTVVSQIVTPSEKLIKYRTEIKKAVYNIVKNLLPVNLNLIKDVATQDQKEVLDHIDKEIKALHEGSLVRFGLTESEFLRWKTRSK